MPIVENIYTKRDERARRIDRGKTLVGERKDFSSDMQRRIIKSTRCPQVTELVNGIKHGQWTACDTISAFILQAIKAHEATNCLTEGKLCIVLFEEALAAAEKLDEDFKATGELRGGLHGVPVTFKDFDNTIGFTQLAFFSPPLDTDTDPPTSWVDEHATQDAELVAQARSMGAIVIAKTNVPQTMMGFECVNPLWGQTNNPYNPSYSSGGSSGGEAAVLRFSGSALGLGSDVGGSLRSVADIKRTCELYFGRPSTTPSVNLPPVKYRTDLDFNGPLRIGYFKTDRFIRASPACQRAVQEAANALSRVGQECIEINPPDMADILRLFVEHTAADGYETMMSNLKSDKQLTYVQPTAFVRAISGFLVKLLINDPSFAHVFVASRPRTVREFWAASATRIKANDDLQYHLWASAAPALGLDAVICPVQAMPCVPHGSTKTLTPMAVSTAVWNVIECPVGIVPVTRVDPTKDALGPDWLDRGKTAGLVLGGAGDQVRTPSHLLERAAYGEGKRLLQPLDEPVPVYDAKKMAGLPVGVQIVGRPWEDEKVIYVMEVLDEALGERGFGPGMDEEWRNQGNL
ncbi:hypothetical protein FRC10_009844 [Ceratobasidium sp. 414]|nr:hypothetical protein FRC10_009844 [Ceratobasidium sp. 414]